MQQLPLLKKGALPPAAGRPPKYAVDSQQHGALTQKNTQRCTGNVVVDLNFLCSSISFHSLPFHSVDLGAIGREGVNLNVYICCLSLQKAVELISGLP